MAIRLVGHERDDHGARITGVHDEADAPVKEHSSDGLGVPGGLDVINRRSP